MSLFLLLVSPSLAATLTVGASGADSPTIQGAIDAASDGDHIEIAAGTYAECVDLSGKDLELSGASETGKTTLDGAGCESALVADGAESATLAWLTIANSGGRCIHAGSGADLDLSHLTLSGCGDTSMDGGGMAVEGGTVSMSDSALTDNTAGSGGALWVGTGSTVVLDGVEIADNRADTGAGVYVPFTGTLTLTDCSVHDNDGAAIEADGRLTLTVEGGTMADNTGSALVNWGNGTVVIDGVRIEGNTDTALYQDLGTIRVTASTFLENSAGAIYDEEGTLTVDDTTFQGNTATSGSAIELGDGGKATVTSSTFQDNVATRDGGAIYLYPYENKLTLTDAVFSGNQAGGDGGAIWTSFSSVTASGCTFSENVASDDGGAIYDSYGGLDLSDTAFEANTAGGDGGAISASDADWYDWGPVFLVRLDGLTLTENVAQGDGGALDLYGMMDLSMKDCTLQGNQAAGASSSGGGLYLHGSIIPQSSGNLFCGNQAATGGGAALEYNEATFVGDTTWEPGEPEPDTRISWHGDVFSKNVATGEGGGVYLIGNKRLSFYNNTLVGNQGGSGGGAAFGLSTDTEFYNNIVAYTAAGDGVWTSSTSAASAISLTCNDWYDNVDADTGGSFTFDTSADGNIVAPPLFASWSASGDCASDDLHLRSSSTLIDAGDPAVLDDDGTVSDIGAYGPSDAAVEDTGGDASDTALDTGEPADTAVTVDTASGVETADTGTGADTADTAPPEVGDTVDTADTAPPEVRDTVDIGDTAPTEVGDTADTVDTGDTGDSADSADSADSGDTGDSEDSADTGEPEEDTAVADTSTADNSSVDTAAEDSAAPDSADPPTPDTSDGAGCGSTGGGCSHAPGANLGALLGLALVSRRRARGVEPRRSR